MEELHIMGWKESSRCSAIWRDFGKIWTLVNENLNWEFGNGHKIMIGCLCTSVLGSQKNVELIEKLNQRGYFYIKQIIQGWEQDVPRWKYFTEVGLEARWKDDWQVLINSMRAIGLCRNEDGNRICCGRNNQRKVITVKETYTELIKIYIQIGT